MKELLSLVEAGQVSTIIVKDMSRFGRDYLQVGQYTEIVFPSCNVRFIAVNDGVDSDKGQDDFTPIRNLFNDFYARDTSKKVRALLKAKGTSGQHMNRPPYGYLEGPMRKGHWIIDPETAPVVKRIFDLALAGSGPKRIANLLEKEKVPTSKTVYAHRHGKPFPAFPYHWEDGSIVAILERMEYTGCTCNFKTFSKSYKLKKRIPNQVEDMFIVEDTQEAIVPKEQWGRVQELRKQRHRTIQRAEREGFFTSLLVCADCGSRMHFSAPVRALKEDRIIISVPSTRQAGENVQRTTSGNTSCVTSCWNAFKLLHPMFERTRKVSRKNGCNPPEMYRPSAFSRIKSSWLKPRNGWPMWTS